MTAPYRAHADPPPSLADRLKQLNDNLQDLAVRLKDARNGATVRSVFTASSGTTAITVYGSNRRRRSNRNARTRSSISGPARVASAGRLSHKAPSARSNKTAPASPAGACAR